MCISNFFEINDRKKMKSPLEKSGKCLVRQKKPDLLLTCKSKILPSDSTELCNCSDAFEYQII